MNTETILVVDDDVEIAKSIQLYLNSQNYKVLIAHDGQEALDLFDGYYDAEEKRN